MHVTDLKRDVSLRVTGEIHIGGVMLKLVEKLGMYVCMYAAAMQRPEQFTGFQRSKV